MADEIDFANKPLHLEMNTLLANRVTYAGPSAYWCDECGEAIPAARREALPGVTLCIECASELEREVSAFRRTPTSCSHFAECPDDFNRLPA